MRCSRSHARALKFIGVVTSHGFTQAEPVGHFVEPTVHNPLPFVV